MFTSNLSFAKQDPENITSPTLDSFFTTISSLRSVHGVPISVVVIDATPGGLGDRLSKLRDPALRGSAGVVASQLHVPLPQMQLGKLNSCSFASEEVAC